MENFDPNQPAEGLGDLIAKITHKLGIAKIAEDIAHAMGEEDCGCERRREQLNNLVPFKKQEEEKNDGTEGIKND